MRKNYNSLKIDPICNFLTIIFCENLQENFLVLNQYLIIQKQEKNAKKFNLLNILTFLVFTLKNEEKC